MPKRIRTPKRPTDVNQLAHFLVNTSTQESDQERRNGLSKEQVSFLMAEMGRRGGKKGGKRRLQTMTPEERSESGLKAAKARWKNRKPSKRRP